MKLKYEVFAQSGEEISKVLSTYPLGKRIAQTVIDVVNGLGQHGRITDGYVEDDGTKVFQVSTPEFDYRVGLDGKPTRDALTDETVGELHAISFAQNRVPEADEPEMTVRIRTERVYAGGSIVDVVEQDANSITQALAYHGCLAVVTTTSLGLCAVVEVCNVLQDGQQTRYQIRSLSSERRTFVDFNGKGLDGGPSITGVYPPGTRFELKPKPQSECAS